MITHHTLAVYGTLKNGFGNNHFMRNSEYLGSGITKGSFFMDEYGAPMVFKEPNYAPVKVDVYKVPDRDLTGPIDGLESNGSVYNREVTEIILDNNEEVEAWLYFGLPKFQPSTPTPPEEEIYNWGAQRAAS
ncbi:MAG: gamma-glutamylcyclotransferase [Candidatus Altiarchaeales archaeon]|nr:gamma-glutamylcyclotransferase [Candidatus Altiarchaeales archaeon]